MNRNEGLHMNKMTRYIFLVLPVFMMAAYAFLNSAIIVFTQQIFNPTPASLSTDIQKNSSCYFDYNDCYLTCTICLNDKTDYSI